MSAKIVFNGTEYGSIEVMPPNVRKQYEATLALLGESGNAGVRSLLPRRLRPTFGPAP